MNNPPFKLTPRQRWLLRLGWVLAITFLAGALRLRGATITPGEWDEDDYMTSAAEYYKLIQSGHLERIPDVKLVYEHPPLIKLMYALTIDGSEVDDFPKTLVRGQRAYVPETSLQRARQQSALAGTLTVLVLALVNPLVGLILAVQPMHQHYTSVAYLEALPVLFTTLTALLYQSPRRYAFWLSAVCFGIAVAGKYPYAIVGVTLLAHALVYHQRRVYDLIAWGLLALAVFFALNPYLWPEPLPRLREQLAYHDSYASDHRANYLKPSHQLVNPHAYMRDENSEYITPRIFDIVIFVLALIGVVPMLRARSFWGWWLVGGVVFLSFWPTQWIQHNMVVVVPYVVSSVAGLYWLWYRLRPYLIRRRPQLSTR